MYYYLNHVFYGKNYSLNKKILGGKFTVNRNNFLLENFKKL